MKNSIDVRNATGRVRSLMRDGESFNDALQTVAANFQLSMLEMNAVEGAIFPEDSSETDAPT